MNTTAFLVGPILLVAGVLAIDAILAWSSHVAATGHGARGQLLVAVAWLASLATLAPPVALLASGRGAPWTAVLLGLLLALAFCLAMLLLAHLDRALLPAWLAWATAFGLIAAHLADVSPIGAGVLVAIALLGPASAIAERLPSRRVASLALVLTSLALLVAIGSLVASSPTSALVDLANGRPTLTLITSRDPTTSDFDSITEGIVTTGLGQSDRVVQLSFEGRLTVSKPNAAQVIHLSIQARLGRDPHQLMVVHAEGVPLPSGSLVLRSASVVVHAPGLAGSGTASLVLARSIFGLLRTRAHAYSYLLSYVPRGNDEVTGTLDLWPERVATNLR